LALLPSIPLPLYSLFAKRGKTKNQGILAVQNEELGYLAVQNEELVF